MDIELNEEATKNSPGAIKVEDQLSKTTPVKSDIKKWATTVASKIPGSTVKSYNSKGVTSAQ